MFRQKKYSFRPNFVEKDETIGAQVWRKKWKKFMTRSASKKKKEDSKSEFLLLKLSKKSMKK